MYRCTVSLCGVTVPPGSASASRLLAVALGGIAGRQQAGGVLELERLHQDAFLAIGQIRLALAGRPDEAGRRLRVAQRVGHAAEADGVLAAAHEHGLLVVRRLALPPPREPDTGPLVAGMLRMDHDPGAACRRPPHRLRIPPALVADRHPERDAIHLEEPPAMAGHVEPVLARIELRLRLVALDPTLRVDDHRHDLAPAAGAPPHAQAL